MSNDAILNATIYISTYFEEDTIETNVNNNESSSVSWMLKLILLQLGLCCLLIVCYIGIRMRIKKLNINKVQIQQQIDNEKHNKNSLEQPPKTNASRLRGKFNNSGGISMFAMPQPAQSSRMDTTIHTNDTLREISASETSMDETYENKNNNKNNRIKRLLIKMRNKNDKNDKEIEMSAYEQSGDGPFSLRSTFPNGTIVSVHRARIDTDNTFPSIPNETIHIQVDNDNQSAEGIQLRLQTKSTMDHIHVDIDSCTPMYDCYNVGTPESSTYGKYRKTSYIQVCDKCGNVHVVNCNDGETETVPNCNAFCKFNTN